MSMTDNEFLVHAERVIDNLQLAEHRHENTVGREYIALIYSLYGRLANNSGYFFEPRNDARVTLDGEVIVTGHVDTVITDFDVVTLSEAEEFVVNTPTNRETE